MTSRHILPYNCGVEKSQILQIIHQVPGWEAVKAVINPLPGGLTNQNYRIDIDEDSFVLRIPGADTHLLGIDRQHEFICTTIAAQIGIGPEVICFLPDEPALVTKFVHGEALSEDGAPEPRIRKSIALALRRCHAGPAFPGVFSPFESVHTFHAKSMERRVHFPSNLHEGLALMDRLESALMPVNNLVPCHNDLVLGNMIDDGKSIQLIDWEYAGMGDRFYDLGNLTAFLLYNSDQVAALLNDYFGEIRPEHIARVELMRIVSDLREAFWYFLQSGVSKLDHGFAESGVYYLNRALNASNAPYFTDWLAITAASKE